MVILALALTCLIGMCALVVDVGLLYYEHAHLSNSVDAAALAGAQELVYNKSNAANMANLYLEKNNVDPKDAEIALVDGDTGISVVAKSEVNYYFAKIFGYDKGDVKATAIAKYAPISGVSRGIRPFAIEQQPLVFGQTYVLKEGGGNGSNGNYGALALGGSGANVYKNNIINAYNGHLQVGDYVTTEPGNMSGPTEQGITELIDQCKHCPSCTFDNYNSDCPKIITVIIVDSLNVNGRKPVQITGFASFFLEGVAGDGKNSIVTGKFISRVGEGDVNNSQTDFGLRGIKLTH